MLEISALRRKRQEEGVKSQPAWVTQDHGLKGKKKKLKKKKRMREREGKEGGKEERGREKGGREEGEGRE